MLRIRTRGCRMVGEDDTMEPWRLPQTELFDLSCFFIIKKIHSLGFELGVPLILVNCLWSGWCLRLLTHSATLVRYLPTYLPTYLPIYLSLSFKRLHVFQLSSIIPPHLLLFLYITFVKVTSPKLSPASTLSLSQMTFPRIVEWKTAFLSFSVGLLQTRWRILLSFNSCVNH